MMRSLRLRPSAGRGRRRPAAAAAGGRRRSARTPLRRRAIAWLVLVGGIGMSLAGGAAMHADVERQSRSAFNAEASDVAASMATSLARMNDLTVTMRTFVATHP